MRKSLLAIGAILLVFSTGAHALFVQAPATVVVNQAQKEFGVKIWNDGFYKENYSVRLFGPFDTAASPSSGALGPESTVTSTVSILHGEALAGDSFEATLEVELGSEIESRKIRVLFKELKEAEEPASGSPAGLASLAGFYGAAAGFLTVENVFNSVLAVVAAVLLIAFVARFIKRLEVRK